MEPKASDVFLNAIHAVLDNCHFCLPGVFTAYDFNTKKASVQPGILMILNDGKQTQLQLPIITDVPVQWPGTGKAIIHCEITPNVDTCLILFSERSLDNWLSSNGQSPVIPGDSRQFSLTDAIAIPGVFPLSTPGMVPISGKGVEIINGKSYIQIDDDNNIFIKNGNGVAELKQNGTFDINSGNFTVDP